MYRGFYEHQGDQKVFTSECAGTHIIVNYCQCFAMARPIIIRASIDPLKN